MLLLFLVVLCLFCPLLAAIDQNGTTTTTSLTSPPLFYMYDLPQEFWWRWPVAGADCTSSGYVEHNHSQLSGIGQPLDLDRGLFLTWHFSLFSSLYNRWKRSRRRTFDPSKASFFVIPYDLGLDGYLNQNTCQNVKKCSYGTPQKLQKYLSNQSTWQRYQGLDHVVMWSLGQYHPWPYNGCDLFMKDFCGQCTFTCYWMDPSKPESRFVSLPFPSSYHWWDGIKQLPWEVTNATTSQRTMLAVYLGSVQTLNPMHTKIRRAMTAQCNASTACTWKQIAHSSIDTTIGHAIEVYKKAIFCLCPPGDDPGRKAVFDAIVSGCIPVIFEKATLYNQYPWHLDEEIALDISVFIPGGAIRSNKMNVMTVLQTISAHVIRLKQLAIEHIAPHLQYSAPPLERLLNISSDNNNNNNNNNDRVQWDPPFDDAADLALDGIHRRIQHLLHNESTHIPDPTMFAKAWHQQYEFVIVKTPGNKTIGVGEHWNKTHSHHNKNNRGHRQQQRQQQQNHHHHDNKITTTTTTTTTTTV